MKTFQDLLSLVRGPVPEKPLIAIWDSAPCHASLVGGMPDMRRYYFDVGFKLSVQTLRLGTPKEVRKETLACLKAAQGRRLLLSSGTGTTPDVIPENMRMMIQTALSGV